MKETLMFMKTVTYLIKLLGKERLKVKKVFVEIHARRYS